MGNGDRSNDKGADMRQAQPLTSAWLSSSPGRGLAWACLALALLWVGAILWRQTNAFTDFSYIYLAGTMWRTGLDPYSPDFVRQAYHVFAQGVLPTGWFYPFHWYPLAVLPSFLPELLAFRVWIWANLLLVLAVAWLAWRVAHLAGSEWPPAAGRLLLAYALTTTLLTAALRTGQPAIPCIIGLPIAAWGLATRRSWAVAIGATLLMLKPQIGIPCVAALLILPGGFVGTIAGGIVTCLLCLPAMGTESGLGAITHFIANMRGGYTISGYNLPGAMTGIAHFVEPATGIRLSVSVTMLLATASAFGLALLWRWRGKDTQRDVAFFLVTVAPACVGAFASLHLYDLTVLLVALPFLPLADRRALPFLALGYLLLWRVENVAGLMKSGDSAVATLASIAILFLCVGWALTWRSRSTREPRQPA